ncbi:MAG: sensor histidine kinase [Lachnospiraceae bacterium]
MIKNIWKKRKSLRWSMVRMILIGWFFPLLVLTLVMIFMISERVNNQAEKMIMTSTEKTTEIFEMQVNACITASKEASYISIIKDSWKDYLKTGNSWALLEEISNFLSKQYKYDPLIQNAMLIFTEKPSKIFYALNNGNGGTYNDIMLFDKNLREEVLELSKTLDTRISIINDNGRIYLVRNLLDSKFQPYAVLILEVNKESFSDIMKSVWGYKDAEVYFNGRLLLESGNPAEMDDVRETLLSEIKPGKSNYYYKKHDSYICKEIRDGYNDFIFLIKLDNTVAYSEIESMQYIFAILILFMIPLVIQILHFFHKRVTIPVNEMVHGANAIEKGEYGVQIQNMASNDEFRYMQTSFNHMSEQLKNQFEKIYSEEIALRDAKIMALQSQINPHFLNNTLEIINWEARLNENYKVSGMIEALSTMLEATMNRKAQPQLPLSEELAYVDAYLYIIAQRFGEKFQCLKEIDESLMDVKVPRLIIQPIVENAVEHGMDITNQGVVTIRIYRKEPDYLVVEVEDNGTLTDAERMKIDKLLNEEPDPAKVKRISLGIRNVDQRLKILYGPECGLFINSNKEKHTVSTLLIKIDNESEQ